MTVQSCRLNTMKWVRGLRNLLVDNQSGLKGIVQDDISTNVYKKVIPDGDGP